MDGSLYSETAFVKKYCGGFIVIGCMKIDRHSGVSIYASMDHNPPPK